MGFHDDIAAKAAQMGRTAPEFAKAAQRNANTFWFFAVIAGIVWGLASWKWALIPGALALWSGIQSISSTLVQNRLERGTAEPGRESLEDMFNLVASYGDVLSRHGATGSAVIDDSELPAPKGKLREVLLTLIATVKDDAQRGHLKSGYLLLADFQSGVGSRPIRFDGIGANEDVAATAQRIATQGDDVLKWQQVSLAEMGRLKDDLKKIGQWSE